MKGFLQYLPHIPKSIVFNFRAFEFKDAIKLPVLISRHTEVQSMRGKIYLNKVKTGIVKIGFKGADLFSGKDRTIVNIKSGGCIIFKGAAVIGSASAIYAKGKLEIGDNFVVSAACKLSCEGEITFGDNVLISWNTQILDSNYHKVLFSEKMQEKVERIIIGNNVWLGNNVLVQKGASIADNVVVASMSIVNKEFKTTHRLLGGVPAKEIKELISWSYE